MGKVLPQTNAEILDACSADCKLLMICWAKDSWKRDDSNQEKEIFEHILNLRMDVRNAVLGDNRERIKASESFQEQIQVYSKEIIAASTWKPSE